MLGQPEQPDHRAQLVRRGRKVHKETLVQPAQLALRVLQARRVLLDRKAQLAQLEQLVHKGHKAILALLVQLDPEWPQAEQPAKFS